MAKPQSGVLPEARESALFLILRVRDPERNAAAAARAAAGIPALTGKLARKSPRAKLVSVVGFGYEPWERISPDSRPRGFAPFRRIETNAGRSAPATGGDLLLHVVSRRGDLCFELASQVRKALGDAVEVMEEVHGFRYLDGRDLTGFIDGTENPSGKGRARAALIAADDVAFSSGSFVFTQRYVHDLASWESLPQKEQERIIGRRKRDSRELSDRAKPPTAHISRVVIEEDGQELEILRHSMPYGTTSESGLFFIAYTRDLEIPQKMLSRMLGTSGDGIHDHLLDHTRAVSGAHFFAPSLRDLKSLARKSPARAEEKPDPEAL